MFFKSLIAAFSMYSRIPMPKVEWTDDYMRYSLCFFPFVGTVIGVVMLFVGSFLIEKCGPLLFGCVMTVIPVFITGGIHFDGFLDTMDGYCSYMNKEKRLEILKDPNSGAFAVIGGLVYFTLSIGFWSEADLEALRIISFGYVLSRALSGLGVVLFPLAKKNGMVSYFAEKSHKTKVKIILILFIIIDCAFLLTFNFFGGLAVILSSLICFIFHYYNCIKNFGGITGDLAGFFLQICELAILIVSVILL